MSASLQVVVIGAGYFSQFHLESWQRLAGATLSAIVERDESKHQQLIRDFPDATLFVNIDDALKSVPADIVDIVTPPVSHVDVVQQVFALTHDVALVICQKPFCTSLAEATDLVHNAGRLQRKLVVHENFRFQPWYTQIKSMIDDDQLGEILHAGFRMRPGDGRGPRAYLDRQPYFQKMQRFLVHETGIHWIDTFRYLFGEPRSLYADLARVNPHIAGEDSGLLVFNYAKGLRVMLDCNRHLDHKATDKRYTMGEMIVEGSKATLKLNGEGELFIRAFGELDERPVDYEYDDLGFAGDSVYRLNKHIVEHLRSGTPLYNLAADYLRNIALEELVYRSAETGTRMNCQ